MEKGRVEFNDPDFFQFKEPLRLVKKYDLPIIELLARLEEAEEVIRQYGSDVWWESFKYWDESGRLHNDHGYDKAAEYLAKHGLTEQK